MDIYHGGGVATVTSSPVCSWEVGSMLRYRKVMCST